MQVASLLRYFVPLGFIGLYSSKYTEEICIWAWHSSTEDHRLWVGVHNSPRTKRPVPSRWGGGSSHHAVLFFRECKSETDCLSGRLCGAEQIRAGQLVRMPAGCLLSGGAPGKTDWEETSGPTQDTLEDYVSHLDWECLRLRLIKSYYSQQ